MGETDEAIRIFRQDHGAMPTYYLDELALKLADAHWNEGANNDFVAWAMRVTAAGSWSI